MSAQVGLRYITIDREFRDAKGPFFVTVNEIVLVRSSLGWGEMRCCAKRPTRELAVAWGRNLSLMSGVPFIEKTEEPDVINAFRYNNTLKAQKAFHTLVLVSWWEEQAAVAVYNWSRKDHSWKREEFVHELFPNTWEAQLFAEDVAYLRDAQVVHVLPDPNLFDPKENDFVETFFYSDGEDFEWVLDWRLS